MKRLIPIFLFVSLGLLLSACSPQSNDQSGAAQVAQAAAEQSQAPAPVQGSSSNSTEVAKASGSEPVSDAPTAACPVTQPPDPPFTPPEPYGAPQEGEFWYGSQALWTQLPTDGTWRDLPYSEAGYTQKIFWWRQGYDWEAELEPDLTVTGGRLDGEAPPLVASQATNAFAADIGSAMLVGVDIPTPGCWEITGRIGEQELSFVISVVGSEP